jgi:hypothetical protein
MTHPPPNAWRMHPQVYPFGWLDEMGELVHRFPPWVNGCAIIIFLFPRLLLRRSVLLPVLKRRRHCRLVIRDNVLDRKPAPSTICCRVTLRRCHLRRIRDPLM